MRGKTSLGAVAILGGVAVSASIAPAGTLVPIPPVPDSVATYIRAINDNNEIVGYYVTSDGVSHGFVGTLDGNYTGFDAPGTGTIALGIDNDGFVTGHSDPSADCPISGCGFVRAPDGTIRAVHKGKKVLDAVVQGIVDRNSFVGDYARDGRPNANPIFYGFYGGRAKYGADLTLPFTTDQTHPRGYNTRGTVVGYFHEIDNNLYPAFVLQDGAATAVTYPDDNAWQVLFESVNDKGMVAGAWLDYALTTSNAFLFDTTQNAFSPITVRRATVVLANSINNAGVVALTADDVSYIYCTRKRRCPLGGPNATELPEKWIPAKVRSIVVPARLK